MTSRQSRQSKGSPLPTSHIWLPRAFAENSVIYLMSATHRGDMYHMRAAMALLPTNGRDVKSNAGVVLYDNDTKDGSTDDLTKYISTYARNQNRSVFVTEWTGNQILGSVRPSETYKDFLKGCLLNGGQVDKDDLRKVNVQIISESNCTTFIKEKIENPVILETLAEQMARIDPLEVRDLEDAFKSLPFFNKDLIPQQPDRIIIPQQTDRIRNIMVLHRDSGCTKANGAYPEMDSGAALWDIANIIDSIAAQSEERAKIELGGESLQLNVILCGGATMPSNQDVKITNGMTVNGQTRYSIGEYWLKLKDITAGGASNRDIEAHFFRWAYKMKYFDMVVGFRSGVLDLFTFLGIPTVSITLRSMLGNGRHNKLKGKAFRRFNVEYNMPRHNVTAWCQTRFEENGIPVDRLFSPYWNLRAPKGVEARPRYQGEFGTPKTPGPRRFTKFDKAIVKLGLTCAFNKYLPKAWRWPLVGEGTAGRDYLVTDRVARLCWPLSVGVSATDDAVDEYKNDLFLAEQQDLMLRFEDKTTVLRLQEPVWAAQQLNDEFVEDWKVVSENKED